jgi:hypothetical protein
MSLLMRPWLQCGCGCGIPYFRRLPPFAALKPVLAPHTRTDIGVEARSKASNRNNVWASQGLIFKIKGFKIKGGNFLPRYKNVAAQAAYSSSSSSEQS